MGTQAEYKTRLVIEEVVRNTTRTIATRVKILGYIQKIYAFSPDNQTIEKKELTKIVNDLNTLAENAIIPGGYHSPERNEYANQMRNFPEAREFQFYSVYGLFDLDRKQKYLDTHPADPKFLQIVNKYYPNLKEWSDLHYRLEVIRKILNPTAEERQAKALQEIKGKVNPEIKKAIDEIAENFRQVIEQNEYDRLASKATRFEKLYPQGINRTIARRKKEPEFPELSRFMVAVQKFSEVYVLAPDYTERIIKYAHDISVEIISSWQGKMYDKLGGFISELNKGFKTGVFGKSARSNDIQFSFDDGSRFMITNQVVAKVNQHDTFFYQYPTTFHNAFLPDGSKIENPSEYTVKKAFNEYKGPSKAKDSIEKLAEKQAARIQRLKG